MAFDKLVAELWHPASSSTGSGMLISDGWVLTAHHVIAEEKLPSALNDIVEVRLQGDWLADDRKWYKYRVYWSSPDLDIALLKLDPDEQKSAQQGYSLQAAKLSQNEIYRDCQCIGFPNVYKEGNQSDTASVRGSIDTANRQRQHFVEMKVSSASIKQEAGWKGLSGSVVVYKGHLVGVVIKVSTLFSDNVMYVCPIDALFEHGAFEQINLGLQLPPIKVLESASSYIDADSSRKNKLPGLVCFLNRERHTESFEILLKGLHNNPASRRSFVCAVVGEQKHEHFALVDRFERQVLPKIFNDEPGYGKIPSIEFKASFKDIDKEFYKLQQLLYNKLNIVGKPDQLVDTFNAGDAPRIFFMFVYGDEFGTKQKELLARWTKFWLDLGDQPLMCVVGLVICFCTAEQKPEAKSGSWWKFWGKTTGLDLQDFELEDAGEQCETMELGYCRPNHLDQWLEYLRTSEAYRWSVNYLTPIKQNFNNQEQIAVREVKLAIEAAKD